MIKALLLIFSAEWTWQRIAEAPRKWGVLLVTYVLPMVFLSCAAEGYGLVHWGKARGQLARVVPFPIKQAVVFEAGQFLLLVGTVFLAAKLIKSLGETFHGRHNFSQTFTVAAYGLGPYFLLRLFNAFPAVPLWVTWIIGIVLCMSVLYSGLPLVMRPDPPHALGLYLMSCLFILIITGLLCFITTWYLLGKFTRLDDLISHLTQ